MNLEKCVFLLKTAGRDASGPVGTSVLILYILFVALAGCYQRVGKRYV